MTDSQISTLLPTKMLEQFRERAGHFDTENEFFYEDLAALRASRYLAAPVPKEMGGAGLSLEQLVVSQRRLAAYAPATALGVNMHLVWVQVARFMRELGRGDDSEGSLDWILRDTLAGEIFAFGISEAGNEAVLMDSCSTAVSDGGGYYVSGTKVFTTLSPVWTRLGVHAKCADSGRLIFGFVRRSRDLDKLDQRLRDARACRENPSQGLVTGTISHPGVWNPLGMRATQSWATVLDRVWIAERDVAAKIEPIVGQHPLILGIFSAFSLLTSAVYAGIADRVLELATSAAKRGRSLESETTRLDDADIASRLTTAHLDHKASLNTLELLSREIDAKRVRDDWSIALAACRNQVTDEARRAVDVAMRLEGSRAYQSDSELARLYRDVLAGLFHPSSSSALARSVLGALD